MIAKDDDFIRDCSIDDTDDVPQRSRNVLLLINQVELERVGRWPNVVIDTFIPESTTLPVLVE